MRLRNLIIILLILQIVCVAFLLKYVSDNQPSFNGVDTSFGDNQVILPFMLIPFLGIMLMTRGGLRKHFERNYKLLALQRLDVVTFLIAVAIVIIDIISVINTIHSLKG